MKPEIFAKIVQAISMAMILCFYYIIRFFTRVFPYTPLYSPYGFIDKKGKLVIKMDPKCEIDSFSCHRAIRMAFYPTDMVMNKVFIDTKGRVTSKHYQEVRDFSEGLAAVRLDTKFGFIDTNDKLVIPFSFDNAMPFVDGLAAVSKGGKWGFIEKSGEFSIPAKFDNVMFFSEDLASVELNGKIGYIDKSGSIIIAPKYKYGGNFSSGLALVNGLHYIDKNGRIVFSSKSLPPEETASLLRSQLDITTHGAYPYISNELLLVSNSAKQKMRLPFLWTTTKSNFSEGLAVAWDGQKCGYINRNGEFLISPKFDYAYPFYEDRALIYLEGQFGFIDKSGEFVVKPQFKRAHNFAEGVAPVCFQNERWGFIDRAGKIVIRPRYDYAFCFSEGLAQVGGRDESL